MKKKKAFTLVELLAVVTLLAVIIMVIAPNVITSLNDSKQNGASLQISYIKSAAQNFVSDNRSAIAELRTIGNEYQVTLQDLADAGYIELPIVNPTTGEDYVPSMVVITIVKENDGSFSYEFNDNYNKPS